VISSRRQRFILPLVAHCPGSARQVRACRRKPRRRLSESRHEITEAIRWLRLAGCLILTIGQFLQPTPPETVGNMASNVGAWLKQLRDQGNAAGNCVPAAVEWLHVPPDTGRACQAAEQQRCLAELVAQ